MDHLGGPCISSSLMSSPKPWALLPTSCVQAFTQINVTLTVVLLLKYVYPSNEERALGAGEMTQSANCLPWKDLAWAWLASICMKCWAWWYPSLSSLSLLLGRWEGYRWTPQNSGADSPENQRALGSGRGPTSKKLREIIKEEPLGQCLSSTHKHALTCILHKHTDKHT